MHASYNMTGVLWLLFAAGSAAAQTNPVAPADQAKATASSVTNDTASIPDFAKMRAPNSPAFGLLNLSPSEVERPSNPTQLVATLGSKLTENPNGLVPNGIALEVFPYWLTPAWGLTWDDLNSQQLATPLRTLSLSIATVGSNLPASDPASFTDLAAGARSQVLIGHASQECSAAIGKLDALGQEVVKALIVPDEVMAEYRQKFGFGTPAFNSAVQAYQDARLKERKDFEATRSSISSSIYEQCEAAGRFGFILEAAGAYSWRFEQSNAKRGSSNSGAAWLNASWIEKTWSAILLGRFQASDLGHSPNRSADAGLRLISQQKQWAASVESIFRRTFEGDTAWRYRVAGIVDYRLAGETWVSVSFGRDGLASDIGSLFALANLKWSFGKPQFSSPAP
jgi:hypothetical protein